MGKVEPVGAATTSSSSERVRHLEVRLQLAIAARKLQGVDPLPILVDALQR